MRCDVPNIIMNLISIGKLDNDGYSSEFGGNLWNSLNDPNWYSWSQNIYSVHFEIQRCQRISETMDANHNC